MTAYLQEQTDGVLLDIHVQPKAAHNQVAGLHDNVLKIRITAPPVEGKANAAVITFIAKLVGVPKTAISIASGKQGRRKRLLIRGITLARLAEVISAHLPKTE